MEGSLSFVMSEADINEPSGDVSFCHHVVRPDYDAGAISLTPEFFNAVRDDEPVTLTFHFWGGGTVDYTITKTGTTVTGTSA